MKRVILLGLLAGLVMATGCTTIAKQGYYGATGAASRYFEVRDLGPIGTLDRFAAVQVDPFDPSLMLGAIPPDVSSAVQPHIINQLVKSGLFTQVAAKATVRPALVIRGKFMDYDPGGSAVRAVYGTNPMLSAQIEIVDADSGRVLGVAMVTGTIESVVRTSPTELGAGIGKAIKGLLAAHMTRKPQKE
jgi:Domain of unknown function (DUF4410)